MKHAKRNRFTLLEILFVVTILVILIGLSWVDGSKAVKKQVDRKTKAEITALVTAVENYYIRYGTYPPNDTSTTPHPFSFAETLSDAQPGLGFEGKREMYIDFKKNGINITNENYADSDATATTVLDPFEIPYYYFHDEVNNKFYIWSVGADGVDSSSDDFHGLGGDGDFGDDITSENLHR